VYLTNLTKRALKTPDILHTIQLLKEEIIGSEEPFIWKVLSEQPLLEKFPHGVQSGWVFALKPNTSTPPHRHPNSVQYTAITEGSGTIRIGKREREIQTFDPQKNQLTWYVIPKNVPHSVDTREQAVVVLSFHTCPPNELIEVETSSGRSRFYEKR